MLLDEVAASLSRCSLPHSGHCCSLLFGYGQGLIQALLSQLPTVNDGNDSIAALRFSGNLLCFDPYQSCLVSAWGLALCQHRSAEVLAHYLLCYIYVQWGKIGVNLCLVYALSCRSPVLLIPICFWSLRRWYLCLDLSQGHELLWSCFASWLVSLDRKLPVSFVCVCPNTLAGMALALCFISVQKLWQKRARGHRFRFSQMGSTRSFQFSFINSISFGQAAKCKFLCLRSDVDSRLM